MKKVFLLVLLCFFCLLSFAGCRDDMAVEETIIYLDSSGNCDFGSWASSEENYLLLNDSKGWATLYMMSDESLEKWVETNGLQGAASPKELRENWRAALVAYAQLPDIMLKTIYDADDEGIAKFRAYAEDYLSEDLAREAARASSDDAPIYLDEDSNFDVGTWSDMGNAIFLQAIQEYGASDEEILENHAGTEMERFDGTRYVDTADALRLADAKVIIDYALKSDSALKDMYGADDNAIEKFRAYYSDFFCKRTDIFERIDPDNLEMITTE